MTHPGHTFRPFELETWQSSYEQDVRYELADSGVPAITMRELGGLGLALEPLLDLPLHYPEVNGTRALRERIAALYPAVKADDVLVTVGAAEAGALALEALTEPGDTVAFMTPNYQQLPGISLNSERELVTFGLDSADGWSLRIDELEQACERGVQLIAVCNPNNPTGHVLSGDERRALIDVAGRHDAWLLCDEVYVGTEHDGSETGTLLGTHEKTVVISSLSKAYGLSGLRLGWVVGPAEATAACWRRHEYATIATSAISMAIAEFALDPKHRPALLQRSRDFIAAGHAAINEWAAASAASVVPASATPVAFLRLPEPVSSVPFARRLVEQASVLVAPGAYFGGFDDHVRITTARELGQLRPALELLGSVLDEVLAEAGGAR